MFILCGYLHHIQFYKQAYPQLRLITFVGIERGIIFLYISVENLQSYPLGPLSSPGLPPSAILWNNQSKIKINRMT